MSISDGKPLVIVRADASASIGLGHVMRSLTLAGALTDRGCEVRVIGTGIAVVVGPGLPSGVSVADCPDLAGDESDARFVLTYRPALVVVDGYHFAADFFATLERAGTPYALIDDNFETAARSPVLVLNQNPHATPDMYDGLVSEPILLLGLEHALIRSEFAVIATQNLGRQPDTVFVSIGGSDPRGLTVPIVERLAGSGLRILVALGPAHPSRTALSERLTSFDDVMVIEPGEYASALATSEIAVLGAGSSLWEAALVRTPTIAVVVAENQRAGAIQALDQGVAIAVHDASDISFSELGELVTKRAVGGKQGPVNSACVIDGHGPNRVADAIWSLLSETLRVSSSTGRPVPGATGTTGRTGVALMRMGETLTFNLRVATEDDAGFLRALRNEPAIVAASRVNQPVDEATHRTWLAESIGSATRKLFVVCDAGVPVGQARLDATNHGEWVSIAMTQQQQGRGHGREVLRSLQQLAGGNLFAEVRSDNVASLGLFKSAGFEELAADGDFIQLRWTKPSDPEASQADIAAGVGQMLIDGTAIGEGRLPYVIAEVSANHDGSMSRAIEVIHAAKEAGADAVKLQHYTPETITVRSEHPDFQVKGGTLWDGRQLADLYAEAMTPWEWTEELVATAKQLGLTWFSSPFDPTAVDFLASFDMPAYKIASFEIIDLPLIRHAARQGKPLLISTGMATLGEIDDAVGAALGAGAPSIGLLRCNSGYPALPEEMDLRAIPLMEQMWRAPVGLSDHSIGHTASVVAVALGACIIEKHLTLKRSDGGPDAEFSAEPDEFADLVKAVREAHSALGSARFGPSPRERASRELRRSLRTVKPIRAGEEITADLVRSVRPSGGLLPDDIDRVLGRVADCDLDQGDPITWDVLRPAPSS